MTQNLILLISMISLFVSCNNDNKDFPKNSDKELITQLINKYPELAKDTINDYYLIRTVIIGNQKIGIKLFGSENEDFKEHKIIVLNNEIGKPYAIPLFSNSIREYWNFENEPKNFNDYKFNSLFEKEFLNAINKLGLNDTKGTGYRILTELLYSILHCQTVKEHDAEKIHSTISAVLNNDLPKEDDEDCELRSKRNYEQVLKGIVKSEYMMHYNAYFDTQNNRIYQYEFPQGKNKKIEQLKLKVYRQDCIAHAIYM